MPPLLQYAGALAGLVVIVAAASAILFTMRSNAAAVWRSTAEGWEAKARELDLELREVRQRMATMEADMAHLQAQTNVLPLFDTTRDIKALLDNRTAIIHRIDEAERQRAADNEALFATLRTHVFPQIDQIHAAIMKQQGGGG